MDPSDTIDINKTRLRQFLLFVEIIPLSLNVPESMGNWSNETLIIETPNILFIFQACHFFSDKK